MLWKVELGSSPEKHAPRVKVGACQARLSTSAAAAVDDRVNFPEHGRTDGPVHACGWTKKNVSKKKLSRYC